MCSALGIVYIVAETEYIFVKIINILECDFHHDTVRFSAEEHGSMERFLVFVHIADKTYDTVLFVEGFGFCYILSFIGEYYSQFRIQICRFMKPALNIFFLETCLFEYCIIREEIDLGTRTPRTSYYGK